MKKLITFLLVALSLSVNAQFPFPLGGNFSNLSVDTKLSAGIAYSSTTARVHIKGSGATSATTSLYVEDNASSLMLNITDDAVTTIRSGANLRYKFGGGTLSFLTDALTVRNQTIAGSTITWDYARHTSSNSSLIPSATSTAFWMQVNTTGTDAAFVGSNTLRVLDLKPTWNLSVASVCDVVGIDYNPTVTLIQANHYAALFRSGRVGIGTATPVSSLEVTNSFGAGIATVTTNTTLGETHYTVLVDCTAGAVTITLPPVATSGKRIYNIKKIDVSANGVTIDGNAAETIDGAATKSLANQYNFYNIQNNGSAWYIIGNN